MTISKEIRGQIEAEIKYKEEIDFLRSLGKFKLWSTYGSREIEFYRELTKVEVESFLRIFPKTELASEFDYAKDFAFGEKDIPEAFDIWFGLNASKRANSGVDGNGFSGWV